MSIMALMLRGQNFLMTTSILLASSDTESSMSTNSNGNDLTGDQMIGGGEVLNVDTSLDKSHEYKYLNTGVMNEFKNVPLMKIAICILLIIACVAIILNMLRIRSIFKDSGIAAEISNVTSIKRRDAYVIRANKFIESITKKVNSTGFSVGSVKYEYMEYNIKRAGIKIPGGFRYMTPDEFNACVKLGITVGLAVSIVIMAFVSAFFGGVMIVGTIVLGSTMPMMIMRNVVANKDNEIKENFTDMYLMLHYTLMTGSKTPIAQILRSYNKTTNSDEMHRFVDNCTNLIETHGEYKATRMIAKDYREIPEVDRLMRLVRQQQDGANIEEELKGFRAQLIANKEYQVEVRKNKLVSRANASFNILMLILVQAILSAMAIYLPDISSMTSIM